ncbi:hypothetical protein [Actinoplanes derwentensis]|uniref:Uncharacterized protein n=1 Tax=Actinoplanes derwentensis TaxID=113562 RepID=A0A1H1SYX7_9ACTN|nr:hypothetical protein [Actinoplanes derwentensis]GID90078.1 hypothetical protein Ade03nite_90020 [Actinoplanes derwentensis]SDS53131.1 hypothetical protein SAMN04489716_0989 [Actinoplanes derwentensis]
MTPIGNRAGIIVTLLAAALAVGAPAQAAPAAPTVTTASAVTAKAVTKRIGCTVRRAATWTKCTGDGVKVSRNQQVFLALNSSSGRRVQFRIKDRATGRVVASPAVQLAPNGIKRLYWKNRTTRAVTIDVEARTTHPVAIRATLSTR